MTFAAWRTVFLLAAGIYFMGNVAYVLMISGEVQEWNYPPGQKRAPLALEEENQEAKTEDVNA